MKGGRSIKILKECFEFLKVNFTAIFVLTLWIEFPFIVITNLELLGVRSGFISFWILVVAFGFTFVVTPLSIGSQTILYSHILNGSQLDLKGCIAKAKNKLPQLVPAHFFFVFSVLTGLLLLIIPGLFLCVRLSFFPFLIIFDNYDPVAALKKSYEITQKFFWEIAIPMCIFNFLILVPWFVFTSLFQDPGIIKYLTQVLGQCLMAVLGWVNLIIPFRAYSIYKKDQL